MKSILLLYCLGLCCISACKKDNGERDYWGDISVIKNGDPWMGKILAIQHNFSEEKMNISIETFDQDNIRLDELYFFKIPKRVGRYSLSYTSSQPPDDSLVGVEYFHGYDDVIYDIYEVATTDSTSYLEITEYNDRKDEFRGKFHLTLYRTLKGSINVPDTLIFTEGTFHTRIDN